MRYYIAGVSLLFLITGGTLLGVGIALGSTPLLIGGVIGLALSGLIGVFSNMP